MITSRSFLNCLRNTNKLTRNTKNILTSNNYLSKSSICLASTKIDQNTKTSKQNNISNGFNGVGKPVKLDRRYFHLSSRYANELITIESPGFAESITEGNVSFEKKVGDSVKVDEVIAKIETDKTTIDILSPKDGVIDTLLVEDGSKITAHLPLVKLRVGGAAAAAPAQVQAPAAAAPVQSEKPSPAQPEPVKPSPSVAPAKPEVPPPLPKAPVFSIPVSQVPVTPLKSDASSQPVDITKIGGSRTETKIKMSRMRLTVANRLKNAQNTCAMLTTFNEINMGNLVELRKSFGDQFQKKHNLKLGFMSAFVKASANALLDQPIVNAVIENNEIVYRDYVDISVAVAVPKGLVVPVLRNVEKLNFADIEKEIAALGEKAKSNKLAIEDMQGGTFTISNGGVFGSLFGTPIINLPQSAILGMHGIFDRPVAINGQVVIKPMMYVALTYDHRLIDGREAVTFLRKIKTAVEDPRTLLLDI